MIYNEDGTPYQLSEFKFFDPNTQNERELFNSIDSELFKINGVEIYYYEYLADTSTIDPVYREARQAVISNEPIKLFAYFDPVTSQQYQNVFGIDSPDEMRFDLNYSDVLARIGHPPRVGSRIFNALKNDNWRVKKREIGDWKLWVNELRLTLVCDKWQETATIEDGKASINQPTNYMIN